MPPVDAHSHFFEPLDLFERCIDARFRERAYRIEKRPRHRQARLGVDQKPLQLVNVEELLGAMVSYRQKEPGLDLSNFDRELPLVGDWQNMDKRIEFLEQGAGRTGYPCHGRAVVGGCGDGSAACRRASPRLQHVGCGNLRRVRVHPFPAAHISLREPAVAIRELERAAKLGYHSIFVGAAP